MEDYMPDNNKNDELDNVKPFSIIPSEEKNNSHKYYNMFENKKGNFDSNNEFDLNSFSRGSTDSDSLHKKKVVNEIVNNTDENFKQIEESNQNEINKNEICNKTNYNGESSEESISVFKLGGSNEVSSSLISNNKCRRKMKDGIYKKCKVYFMKYLRNEICKKLKKFKNFFNLPKNQLKLRPLPNDGFNSNVTIDFNKKILKLTLRQMLNQFWGNEKNKRDKENYEFNLKVLNAVINSNISELLEFFDKTLLDHFEFYLNVPFQKDKKKIQNKQCNEDCIKNGCVDCQDYLDTFTKTILGTDDESGIIYDFLYNKGNIRKKPMKNKNEKRFKTTKCFKAEISEMINMIKELS